MIGSSRQHRVFAYGQPIDMRNGFDGLCAVVVNTLKHDVLAGDLFLFVNRRRKRAKVLFWDGTGLVIYCKRLERGCFTAPWNKGEKGPLEMTTSELSLFLEGSVLAGRVALSPAPFAFGPLANFQGG